MYSQWSDVPVGASVRFPDVPVNLVWQKVSTGTAYSGETRLNRIRGSDLVEVVPTATRKAIEVTAAMVHEAAREDRVRALQAKPENVGLDVATIASLDPTTTGKYITWLVEMTRRGPVDGRVTDLLTEFDELATHLPSGSRDINRVRTVDALAALVQAGDDAVVAKEVAGEEQRAYSREELKRKRREQAVGGALGESGFKTEKVTTYEEIAARNIRNGWCVGRERVHFDSYEKSYPANPRWYVITNTDDPKAPYLFFLADNYNELKDGDDNPAPEGADVIGYIEGTLNVTPTAGDPDEPFMEEARATTSTRRMRWLLRHPNTHVWTSLSNNKNVPPVLLDRMADRCSTDAEGLLRAGLSLVEHRNIRLPIAEKLAYAAVNQVVEDRSELAHGRYTTDSFLHIAQTAIRKIARADVLQRLGAYVMSLPLEDLPSTTGALHVFGLMSELARNDKTPPETLAQLAAVQTDQPDNFLRVQRTLAINQNTPPQVLAALPLNDRDLVEFITRNPSTPSSVMNRITQSVLRTGAHQKKPWMRTSEENKLLGDLRAIGNTTDDPELLDQLAHLLPEGSRIRHSGADTVLGFILESIAHNSHIAPKTIDYLLRVSEAELGEAIAKNPATPEALLRAYAKSDNFYRRNPVALNPSTPRDVLESLLNDPEERVRLNSAATLEKLNKRTAWRLAAGGGRLTRERKQVKSSGATVVADKPSYKIINVFTYDAMKVYGAGTKWCIAAGSKTLHDADFWWRDHAENGDECYVIQPKRVVDKSRKYAAIKRDGRITELVDEVDHAVAPTLSSYEMDERDRPKFRVLHEEFGKPSGADPKVSWAQEAMADVLAFAGRKMEDAPDAGFEQEGDSNHNLKELDRGRMQAPGSQYERWTESYGDGVHMGRRAAMSGQDARRVARLIREWQAQTHNISDTAYWAKRFESLEDVLARTRPRRPVQLYRSEPTNEPEQYMNRFTAWSPSEYAVHNFGWGERRMVTAIFRPESIVIDIGQFPQLDHDAMREVIVRPGNYQVVSAREKPKRPDATVTETDREQLLAVIHERYSVTDETKLQQAVDAMSDQDVANQLDVLGPKTRRADVFMPRPGQDIDLATLQIKPIQNMGHKNKPFGGLWTSRLEQDTTAWLEHIRSDAPKWVSDKGYLFDAQPGARILSIDTLADYQRALQSYSRPRAAPSWGGFDGSQAPKAHWNDPDPDWIDWEAAAKDFDAFHVGPNMARDMGWDAESTCWTNMDALVSRGTVPVKTEPSEYFGVPARIVTEENPYSDAERKRQETGPRRDDGDLKRLPTQYPGFAAERDIEVTADDVDPALGLGDDSGLRDVGGIPGNRGIRRPPDREELLYS